MHLGGHTVLAAELTNGLTHITDTMCHNQPAITQPTCCASATRLSFLTDTKVPAATLFYLCDCTWDAQAHGTCYPAAAEVSILASDQ